MKLTILGTGNATVTECYNTCFALSDGNRHFLVDTGGGNRILKVLKDTGIQLEDIHDIFITHEHIDHLLGVIWLIQDQMRNLKLLGKLTCFFHSTVVLFIRLELICFSIQAERLMGQPVAAFHKFIIFLIVRFVTAAGKLHSVRKQHLKERKELYTREGREYYHGKLFVPDDLEVFEL